jgi:hypothetical protein
MLFVLIFLGCARFGASETANDAGTPSARGTPGVSQLGEAKEGQPQTAIRPNEPTFGKVSSESAPKEPGASQSREDLEVQHQLALFTEGLVWVGIAQAVVLLITLIWIRQQAKILEKHAGHFEDLSDAAKASIQNTKRTLLAIKHQADLMYKSHVLQFRPRIVVRGGFLDSAGLGGSEALDAGRIEFVLVNIGGTDALIYKTKLIVRAVDYSEARFDLFEGATSLEELHLRPGQSETAHIPIGIESMKEIRDEISRREAGFGTGRGRVYFAGSLWYKDDLGNERSTGVFRRFDPKDHSFVAVMNSDSEYSD